MPSVNSPHSAAAAAAEEVSLPYYSAPALESAAVPPR